MDQNTSHTLQEPCELWSHPEGPFQVYYFIRQESAQIPVWHVVIACESGDDDQNLEILDEFVTDDARLVEGCRRGKCELRREDFRASGGRAPLS